MKSKNCLISFSLIVILSNFYEAKAQTNIFPPSGSAGIGTISPNTSAIFEVKSTTKGILIPRMTKQQRNAVTNPANYLLIFQTDSNKGLYYFTNANWYPVNNVRGLNNNVFIGKDAGSQNLTGTGNMGIGRAALYHAVSQNGCIGIGDSALYNNGMGASSSQGIYNTAIGHIAMQNNTTGSYNTSVGMSGMNFNTTGSYNTSTGYAALYSNTTGIDNTANGVYALRANTSGYSNAAFGKEALNYNSTGSNNTAAGRQALYYNSMGNFNCATGRNSLHNNTTGSGNTASGYQALYFNSTGWNNTAAGYQALYANTTGYSNIAIGSSALQNNNAGHNMVAIGDSALFSQVNNASDMYSNTAIGSKALYSNSTGYQNTATGVSALYANTTGKQNTANGRNALTLNTTGNFNTAEGVRALSANTTGNNNSALGYLSNVSADSLINTTVIGGLSTVNSNNKVRIGNANVTVVESNAGSWTTSDGRFKINISEEVKGLEFINLLRPVIYNFDVRKYQEHIMQNYPDGLKAEYLKLMEGGMARVTAMRQSGFIAQEVELAAKQCGYDFNGVHSPENPADNYSLSYEKLVVPLVKSVQELSIANETLKNKTEQQQKEIDALRNSINKLEEFLSRKDDNTVPKNSGSQKAELEQNQPNPFNAESEIKYFIPASFHSAYIEVAEISGKVLKKFNIKYAGYGEIILQAREFAAGSYYYYLTVDGEKIDTRKMELTR